jgi:hypothetical protein
MSLIVEAVLVILFIIAGAGILYYLSKQEII